MYFVDSLKGFKRGYNGFSKTTNGGVDWILKPLLTGGNIAESELNNFVIQDAIIWGDRGSYWDGVSNIQGLIWKTTNEGDNWGYQLPGINNTYWDISFTNSNFGNSFTNSNFGNASPRLMQSNFSGARTTTGGDTITYYTSVTKINETIPVDFVLYQNFPNPFNPVTNIRYDVKKQSQIILKVYDITGKEIKTLVNQVQNKNTC